MFSFAQVGAPGYPIDQTTAADLTSIAKSVDVLTRTFREFVDKFSKVGGLTLTEKQQKLVLGMELLARTELRVATLQKSQIELTEKLNETKSKLIQIELDLRPRNIDRSVAFEGTTETEELREAKRQKLSGEKTNLTALSSQIETTLRETAVNLRDAQSLAYRLRRTFLPQVEQEIFNQ